MSLHLRDRTLDRLQGLISRLVSPLEHPNDDAWVSAICRGVVDVFSADGVLVVLPDGVGRPVFRFHDIPHDAARVLERVHVGSATGTLRVRYPKLDQMLRRLAMAGVRSWTPELASRITRLDTRTFPFAHEVAIPLGIQYQANLAVPVPGGVAMIAFFHRSEDHDPHGEQRVGILELIRPAFEQGVRALRRITRNRRAFERQLEADGAISLIFDSDGRLAYQNAAAERATTGEHGSNLMGAARRLAACLRDARPIHRKSAPDPPRLIEEGSASTPGGRFDLVGTLLPAGMLYRTRTVLIRARPRIPALPAPETIQARFGLTARQAEVALLIAEDRTTAEIAERLGISMHTVRRHAEKVLEGLDVRSRKGIGMRLLGASTSAARGG